MFELTRLELQILYQRLLSTNKKIRGWLMPTATAWQGAGKPAVKTFVGKGMTFLGREMDMDLDPRFVAERALLSKVISEHLESRQYYGFISEEEKEKWYVALSKAVTPLRTKVKTKEQRRQKVEEMKAQRLNGHAQSKSVFSQLKDSLQCTKV